ncbi:alkyl hydroperoxide reductase subunit F [Anaeromusa acidaminophila]|uniref:alkyl hydroperoxide reductase subunit F n=1 Tax=Anaeromusa acidaminophila TaxID=81464 RepID=UPI0003795E88|nr:alkyl hydroperoxide reductase subunit F [Anaeromusa acidaminophila]
MLLDAEIRAQLSQYLPLLESEITITANAAADAASKNMTALVEELASLSPKINWEEGVLPRSPSFRIQQKGAAGGIVFAGIPLGHEFTSLVLALLQVSGRPPKVEDRLIRRIQALSGPLHFESYISLSCHNCPEVVQALNAMSALNPAVTHTMIDGALFQAEVEAKNILAVPSVFLNGTPFSNGRMSLEQILDQVAPVVTEEPENASPFDVLVIGGGPAGASAAIYAARKGIRTGMIADKIGGQVNDTLGIENLIGIPYTEGPEVAANLAKHLQQYPIESLQGQRAKSLLPGNLLEIELENGRRLQSKTVIIATGAAWKQLGIPGEKEFRNKGVAYCPHCDGPIFKGKRLAVIGGGNSGVEAAIDLAGLAAHVTLLEFTEALKADQVLQERLRSLPNVTILTNAETVEITGQDKVTGLAYQNRATQEIYHLNLEGVFILVGLAPNTAWLENTIARNRCGEIITDSRGATNISGVFAAGDCTDSPYKQIIISMGSGATAALGAFDHLLRT